MRYCKRCVYPEVVVNLYMDAEGICSACRAAEAMNRLTPKFWAERKKRFERILAEVRKQNKSEYDCIVPVSGGKDSYYQTHIIASEYGLKPLLVT